LDAGEGTIKKTIDSPPMTELREIRLNSRLSQAAFAKRLGVGDESYRAWDSGRRPIPTSVLARARTLRVPALAASMGLPALSKLLGVSVFRLREAARDGRLIVTYGNRTVFRRPIPRATLEAGQSYKRVFYGKRRRRVETPVPPDLFKDPPPDCASRIRSIRGRLNLTQTALALRIGVAGKAVVYQWEARKRSPSPLLWRRLEDLEQSGA
jgi:DNA-binding transcriptional regulator YiaG